MTRKEILTAVEAIICRDRNIQHGEPEDVFATIANFWTSYLSARVSTGADDDPFVVEPHDVAAMMVLFKIARHSANPTNLDNSLDCVGYAAIMGEQMETSHV